jgi:integrase
MLSDFDPFTVGWLIQRHIEDKEQPGSRRLGASHLYTLRRLQRSAIASKKHDQIRPTDFIEHCKARRASGAKPQTVNHDMTYLSSILKYAFEILDWSEIGFAAYRRAKSQLVKEQLIGTAQARDRLPADEEIVRLRALFEEQNEHPRTKIDMALVMDAELATGRRISELCRIERQHVNVEKRTCKLYNLKNPRGKGHNAEFALIEGAWELFERRLREIPDRPDARLFPFNPKSCGARYTQAKNQLGIEGLHMHDNRAECFVRLLDKGYSALQVRKGVSLHLNPNTFENVYARIKPEDLHKGPAAPRAEE